MTSKVQFVLGAIRFEGLLLSGMNCLKPSTGLAW
jgi:hypothetical protein